MKRLTGTMKKLLLLLLTSLLVLSVLLLLPFVVRAEDRAILVEFSFPPPEGQTIESFKLYQEGIHVCTSTDIIARDMECAVNIIKNATDFTLTAAYVGETESPHSPTYSFVVDDTVDPEVPVAPPIILHMIIGTQSANHQ
jgi:hypothetical protein